MLSLQNGISVVGEADGVKGAIVESCRLKPDVVLMDVRMPNGGGVEACRAIRDTCPNTRVLFLSSNEDDEALRAALVGGASGYLEKHISAEKLLRASSESSSSLPKGGRTRRSAHRSSSVIRP